MKKARPKNMDLTTIQLPITGLASILHRVCAVIIWVALAFFMLALFTSLKSAEGFNTTVTLLSDNFVVQFFTWGFLTALGYYIAGGLKHMIQEFGLFETLEGGRLISIIAIVCGVIASVLFGVWIWG